MVLVYLYCAVSESGDVYNKYKHNIMFVPLRGPCQIPHWPFLKTEPAT